jgi:hypothetical protein
MINDDLEWPHRAAQQVTSQFDHEPWHGENPRVFKYQLFHSTDRAFIRTVYYEGFEVLVVVTHMHPEDTANDCA